MYTTAELFIMAFSPPYGDGMLFDNTRKATTSFSPPYGDRTGGVGLMTRAMLFSPPYGDCTFRQKPHEWSNQVFAPLRGWYHGHLADQKGYPVFAPLRGWYTLNISQNIVKWKS